MHPLIAASLANSFERDRLAVAAARRPRAALPREPAPTGEVVIRRARSGDAAALRRLGALDSDPRAGRVLAQAAADGDVLVAEIDGRIEAARTLAGDVVVADPFQPSALDVTLLALRSEQIQAPVAPARLGLGRLRLRLH